MTTPESLFAPEARARLYDAIALRTSCRQYAGAPSPADWAALSYLSGRYSLPGARILLTQVPEDLFTGIVLGYGRITGCTTVAVLAASISEPRSRLNAGIVGEAFVLEATAMGLGTCWVGGTYKRKQLPAIQLRSDETVLALIAVGMPRSAAQPEARRRKALEKLCRGDHRLWPEELRRAAVAVQMAPSALNLQPWTMSLVGDRFVIDAPDRQQVDLGIAVCHAELTLESPHRWHFGDGRREPLSWVSPK